MKEIMIIKYSGAFNKNYIWYKELIGKKLYVHVLDDIECVTSDGKFLLIRDLKFI